MAEQIDKLQNEALAAIGSLPTIPERVAPQMAELDPLMRLYETGDDNASLRVTRALRDGASEDAHDQANGARYALFGVLTPSFSFQLSPLRYGGTNKGYVLGSFPGSVVDINVTRADLMATRERIGKTTETTAVSARSLGKQAVNWNEYFDAYIEREVSDREGYFDDEIRMRHLGKIPFLTPDAAKGTFRQALEVFKEFDKSAHAVLDAAAADSTLQLSSGINDAASTARNKLRGLLESPMLGNGVGDILMAIGRAPVSAYVPEGLTPAILTKDNMSRCLQFFFADYVQLALPHTGSLGVA